MADTNTGASVAAVERQISSHRRLLAKIALLVFVIYAAAGAFFYFRQDKMTFPAPATYPRATPLDAGIPFEDLHIPVNKSQQIHAWWIPAAPASASADKVLLVFHGNGYVLEQSVSLEMIPLHSLGANLLLVDYRGYGSSSAEIPTEKRVNEDARAAFDYLTTQRKIPSRNIIFFGRSIGTGPATEMAKEHADAGGLSLISPFTSTVDIAKTIWYLRIFPLALLSHNRFDNLLKIGEVHIPVFIAVGGEDRLTPPAMAQALFQSANNPKQFYISPEADHNNVMEVGVASLQKQITSFIKTTASQTGGRADSTSQKVRVKVLDVKSGKPLSDTRIALAMFDGPLIPRGIRNGVADSDGTVVFQLPDKVPERIGPGFVPGYVGNCSEVQFATTRVLDQGVIGKNYCKMPFQPKDPIVVKSGDIIIFAGRISPWRRILREVIP
jgi:uncharacterized protein